MKLDSNLLNEAIADAKAVRETAVQTAIGRLKEAFEPTVRQLITQKLSEEEGMEDEEDTMPTAPESDTEDQMEEEYSEDTYDSTNPEFDGLAEEEDMPEEEDEMGLDEILAELEGEDSMEMPEEDDDEDEEDDDDMEITEEEDEISMDELDEILAELESEDDMEISEEEDTESEIKVENRRLRRELTEAKSQLKEAYRAITTQKNAINEVNLLNSKLLFLTKITSAHKLSPEKQVKILEAFDRAQNIREVKLVYATICESLDRQPKNLTKNAIVESASKPTRAIKKNLNEQYAFANRWKQLAGIK